MRKLTLSFLLTVVFISCKQEITSGKQQDAQEKPKKEIVPDRSQGFPEEIASVFEAHGGIRAFDEKNTLVFELSHPEGNEKHTIDLKTRHARIETDKFTLGFDGDKAWIQQDSTYFKGDPRFYHNLMFYFYAMPFVLGDDGISYEKTDTLTVGDQSYPGYKISYGEGVGDSPKDNYFLYYDANSNQMKFLGYTVTFFSKETSEKISLIEYSDWNDVDGLLLPETLKWRTYQEGKVGEVKSERTFVNAKASKEKLSSDMFEQPATKK